MFIPYRFTSKNATTAHSRTRSVKAINFSRQALLHKKILEITFEDQGNIGYVFGLSKYNCLELENYETFIT